MACSDSSSAESAQDSGGPDADGGTDGPVIVPPKDCDIAKEPKDSPACVDDMVGVFVDAQSGVDSGPGTKMSPVKTIKAALEKAGQKRIYVCEGTYKEHVKLTGPNSMYGGFSCMKWEYSGTKAKIAPEDKGYALHAEKLSSAIVIADLELSVVDATDPGESSIAMFLSESMKVSLKRVDVKAGKGKDGADGAAAASNLFSESVGALQGTTNTAASGGDAKICACKSYGTTGGGKGGNAGNPAEQGGPGIATPQPTPMGPSRTGAGGAGFNAGNNCAGGVSGSNGKPRAKGKAALESGTLDAKGWAPSPGGAGETGDPGGGGGGGGGGGVNGSGGGACGGCGGAGGLGGKGGGASIAILALSTTLTTETVKLTSSDAGKGGAGGKAGAGGPGGEGGSGTCAGGFGGNGSGGGGGAGGSGGLSAGIVRKGGAVEGTPTVTLGAKGAAGLTGEPGIGGTNILDTAESGAAGEAGRDGAAKDIIEVQ